EIVKAMVIVFAGDFVVGPGSFLHAWEDHSLVGVGGLLLGPDIPVPVFGFRVAAGGLEPGVIDRGMGYGRGGRDAGSAGTGGLGELHEIAERAVSGIDAVIIADIVAVVAAGGGEEGLEPEAIDVQAGEVVELARKSQKVAHAVAVAIGERLDVDRVN